MKTIKMIAITAGAALVFFLIMSFVKINRSEKMKGIPQPNDHGFAVVELFTSEGCSSCPPADELIQSIRDNNQNKRLFLLAYHVDYWDHLGWKDRFSNPAFTKRQRYYAEKMNLETIYTPQIVINGQSEYIGSDKSSVVSDISGQLRKTVGGNLSISSEISNNKLLISHNAVLQANEELVLALVQKNSSSAVKAGENKGRNLSHAQIVRELVNTMTHDRVSMVLPKDFSSEGWELIGFIQNKENGHIKDAAAIEILK